MSDELCFAACYSVRMYRYQLGKFYADVIGGSALVMITAEGYLQQVWGGRQHDVG